MTVDEILEALASIVTDAEGRDLTDDEMQRYEELEGQLQRAQKSEGIKQRQTAYQTPVRDKNVTVTASTGGGDELERAFEHYLRTGRPNADIIQLRDQNIGTPADGGFTVPPGFRNRLVERMVAFGGLANEVETITTSTGQPLEWPTLDDTSNSGEIANEGSAGSSGADLTFGTLTLGAFKYVAPGADNSGADPLRVSVELLQDSAFDIAGLVARKLGERIARKQAVDWVTGAGSGSNEPLGITGSGGNSEEFAGAAPTFAELVDALHSVDPAYRMNGVWVFNDTTLALIRKLEDDNERPLWLPQQESGLDRTPGGTLLGHRVVIDQAFDDYSDGDENVWGVFGDVREGYVIRRVRDVTLIVDPFTRAAQGQVNYTVWARADGTVQNPNSFSLLANDDEVT